MRRKCECLDGKANCNERLLLFAVTQGWVKANGKKDPLPAIPCLVGLLDPIVERLNENMLPEDVQLGWGVRPRQVDSGVCLRPIEFILDTLF